MGNKRSFTYIIGLILGVALPFFANAGGAGPGGGSGVDGKLFEAFHRRPMDLPAYKNVLAPLFANIKASGDDGPHFTEIFKTKTWYIAPVDLSKITKDVLGVTFIKNTTIQIAVQTSREIWIDQRLFDAMGQQDQAYTLAHEFMMNLYLLKFMTMKEQCRLATLANPAEVVKGCEDGGEWLSQVFPSPPPPLRPLNKKDYYNIRFATSWFFDNAQKPVSDGEFGMVLGLNGFDNRLFNPEFDRAQTELKVSGSELYDAINGAAISGNMPSSCTGLSIGAENLQGKH